MVIRNAAQCATLAVSTTKISWLSTSSRILMNRQRLLPRRNRLSRLNEMAEAMAIPFPQCLRRRQRALHQLANPATIICWLKSLNVGKENDASMKSNGNSTNFELNSEWITMGIFIPSPFPICKMPFTEEKCPLSIITKGSPSLEMLRKVAWTMEDPSPNTSCPNCAMFAKLLLTELLKPTCARWSTIIPRPLATKDGAVDTETFKCSCHHWHTTLHMQKGWESPKEWAWPPYRGYRLKSRLHGGKVSMYRAATS